MNKPNAAHPAPRAESHASDRCSGAAGHVDVT